MRTSFEAIIRKHQRMVYGIAYNFSNNVAVAEEVAQDVFLRLYESQPDIPSEFQLIAWLRRTATNRSIDILRRASTRSEVQLEVMPDVAAGFHERDPLLDAALRQLVVSLPERQRAVIILRFGEEMEIREIARTLDLPERTVRTHLERALASMREKTAGHLVRQR